jgi:hypothetical protein
MTAKDKDPRARYSVFKWNNDTWEITQNHIAYDYTQELTSLSNSGLPHWKDHASTFVR